MSEERIFRTTTPEGLDYESFPMRLWQKAKVHGVWNPNDIDFEQDKIDWREKMNDPQRAHLLQLCSLFQAGEEAVTLDLLPLIRTVAMEGRLEEEMFLTTFLWEEAKHVDLFQRILREVMGGNHGDLSQYFYSGYEKMFKVELPASLDRLLTDQSVEAQIEASVTYNMVIEGVQAESGYWLFHRMLNVNDLMPGVQEAVSRLKRDESRHIAYGVFFLSRLIVEHGDRAWNAFEKRMAELMPLVEEQNVQLMSFFEGGHPFGVTIEELQQYSDMQFRARLKRLEAARSQSIEELHRIGTESKEQLEEHAA